MSLTKRIFVYGPLAAVVLLVLAYSAYWFATANGISAELERVQRTVIVPGITLQFVSSEIHGYPFRFDIFLEDVTIAARGEEGERTWQAERIAIHVTSYEHSEYVLEADGLQSFSWPNAEGGPQHIFQLNSSITRASATLEQGHLVRFNIDSLNVVGEDTSLEATSNREFSIARAQIHLLAHDNDAIDIEVEIDVAQIGSGYRPALGPDLSRVRVEGRISEAQSLEGLRAGQSGIGGSLEAWRQVGGNLALEPLEAAWGGALLLGGGELFLDQEHEISGRISVSPEDPVSFLGALAQSEMIPPQTRAQLASFRDMVSGLPGGLDLPITMQAHLPLGPGPVAPRLGFENGNGGIIVTFGDAP